ncbi:hypothetical protein Tco_0049089, partial [Tanacetum coccineum]
MLLKSDGPRTTNKKRKCDIRTA